MSTNTITVPVGLLTLTGAPPGVFVLPPIGSMCRTNITCRRIAPHAWQGNNRVLYNRIEFEMARGQADSRTPNPQMVLNWSNDAGNTFNNGLGLPTGAAGQFNTRVYANRCGYARDRVFQIVYTDQVYKGFVGAELDLIVLDS